VAAAVVFLVLVRVRVVVRRFTGTSDIVCTVTLLKLVPERLGEAFEKIVG